MKHRQRTKHTSTFEERLAAEAQRLKEQARKMKPGNDRDQVMTKLRQTEMASHINKWVTSPGLAPTPQNRDSNERAFWDRLLRRPN
jgi:hypothetical protein